MLYYSIYSYSSGYSFRFEIPIKKENNLVKYLVYESRYESWAYKTDDSDWEGDDHRIVKTTQIDSNIYRAIFPVIFKEE